MALNLTKFQPMLRRFYKRGRILDLALLMSPFMGLVRKNTRGGGEAIKTPVMHRQPTGGSASFTQAQDNAGDGGFGAFLQSHLDHFHNINVSHKILKLSDYEQAFLKARKAIDRGFKRAGFEIALKLFRDNGCSMGRIANAALDTTVLTLTNRLDAYTFEVDEVVQFGPNAAGTSLRESGATLTITKVDRGAGELTLSAQLDTITDIAQNDFIFKHGDATLGLTGLKAFIPDLAADVGTLHSLDRSVDVTRLGGYRVDATSMNIEQAAIELAAEISAGGGEPSHLFLNPIKHKELSLLVNSGRAEMRSVKATQANISYRSVVLQGPKGDINIMQDVACPFDRGYMLDLSTFELVSAGEAPHVMDEDGLYMARKANSPDYEIRTAFHGDLTCEAPGFNGVLRFS